MATEVEDLISRAMIALDEDEQFDNPIGWTAIRRLHSLGSREVLNASLAACADADALRRRIGAAILGQLGHSKVDFEPIFTEERYQGLMGLLAAELEGPNNPDVLSDVCFALGHLHDPRAIPALLRLRGHPDANVRSGVVSGLSGYNIPEAIDGLMELSTDSEEHVRNWATFGLGQLISTDTPAIRAALHARLDDPCIDARNEAIEGLATRGDQSVMPVLIRELSTGVALPLLNAAIALARPELCEALAEAADGGLVVKALHEPYDLTKTWAEAMRVCGCETSDAVGSAVQKS
ncbi:MAG TPA: HEAT repeat domain-containing protein [Stellaceae bacterium]|nr:HEAT repeat domain-containing protein [Stellaceae bacterium]